MPQYRLDDKYTSGIWYDQMNGDFAKIQESQDGTMVLLINPENDSLYWDMPVSVWVESEQSNFRPVSQSAVEDPAEVVRRAVRILSRNDVNEMAGIPMQEAIDLRYARQQVNIESK